MKRNGRFPFPLVRRFLLFFIIIAFSVTCSFYLFMDNLQEIISFRFSEEMISHAAKVTFLNVFLLAFIITFVDGLFYYFRIYRPLMKILDFTNRLSSGEFGRLIDNRQGLFGSEYDLIIDNLNMLSKELASIDSMRAEAIGNISHELKTPLSVIHNYAKLLSYDDVPKDKRAEYIEAIYLTTERLSSLIESILRLSRLEKQEIYKKDEVFSLSEALENCIVSFDEKLDEKKISLYVDIDEDVKIHSDKELLDIVWNNLISNAIKFSNLGGAVDISLKEEKEVIVVTVSDSGAGIAKDEIPHIFDKYYRCQSTKDQDGNGLGLAMVKRVLDILGYSIYVTSEKGKGSSFKVELLK